MTTPAINITATPHSGDDFHPYRKPWKWVTITCDKCHSTSEAQGHGEPPKVARGRLTGYSTLGAVNRAADDLAITHRDLLHPGHRIAITTNLPQETHA